MLTIYTLKLFTIKKIRKKFINFFSIKCKNFNFLGTIGAHGGINYSFEDGDGDMDPNLFIGFDKSINPEFAFAAEYDFALNDNEDRSLGSGKGYLNVGIKFIFEGQLNIEILCKNLLNNHQDRPHWARELRLSYIF